MRMLWEPLRGLCLLVMLALPPAGCLPWDLTQAWLPQILPLLEDSAGPALLSSRLVCVSHYPFQYTRGLGCAKGGSR